MTQSTKDRILDVAESLFAEHGFGATSMRSITNAAGVNLAAVNYHFGSKDGLFQAIFARRLTPMNAERLQRLHGLQRRHGGAVPLPELIGAFVSPALELSRDEQGGGSRFIRLLGRSYTESSEALQESVRAMHQEVVDGFKHAFGKALPGLEHEELYWRLHFLIGTLAYCMSGSNMMRLIAASRQSDHHDYERLVQYLTAFLTAGMQAPPSADRTPQSPLHVASGHAHPSS